MTEKSPSLGPGTNEQGFVLVTAMFLLIILTLFGVSMINTSVTEIKIAGNDKLHKQTFSLADGGTEVGSNLLEENIACPDGFTGFTGSPPQLRIRGVVITTSNFWINGTAPTSNNRPVPYPSDTQRHIHFPPNDAAPHTNLYFLGNSSLSTGMPIQMIAGYEGIGYSAATGGGQLVTNVDSQHVGLNNSLSTIRINWRHIIGLAGSCNY